GNALEVRESIEVLKGDGSSEVRETSLVLASRMILMAGLASGAEEAETLAAAALDDGRAMEVFSRFISAQGGDAGVIENPDALPRAAAVAEVMAPRDAFVTGVDALAVGLAATGLGAGRRTVDETVDPAVGIEIVAPIGTAVCKGDVVALVHARGKDEAEGALPRVGAAFGYGSDRPHVGGRLLEVSE
ncbi:pyrimidine-nucleoside phosphorylase, partial [bacterium]|nr:pyrimidine-nucleoside phosphorylase [bacterium]